MNFGSAMAISSLLGSAAVEIDPVATTSIASMLGSAAVELDAFTTSSSSDTEIVHTTQQRIGT